MTTIYLTTTGEFRPRSLLSIQSDIDNIDVAHNSTGLARLGDVPTGLRVPKAQCHSLFPF